MSGAASLLSRGQAIGQRLRRRTAEVFREGGVRAVLAAATRKVRWQLETMFFRPYRTKKAFGGVEYELLIPDSFAKAAYDRSHEWPELRWIVDNVLRGGDHAVDVGANIGFTTVLFAKAVGKSGRVTAIEALPNNADAINENVRLNGCGNVEILNVAAGPALGTADFLAYPNGAVGFRADAKVIKVPVVTLDSLFESKRVDFIKIDVEGYEIEVLKGAKKVLARRPALDVEIHCANFNDPKTAIEEIVGLVGIEGYSFHIQAKVDGVIERCDVERLDLAALSREPVVHLFCSPKGEVAR